MTKTAVFISSGFLLYFYVLEILLRG